MMEFSSFAEFAGHLAGLTAEQDMVNERALEGAAKLIERRAKQKIGDYQEEAGQFVAWAELAESTKRDREKQGYPEDEPLLRKGDLCDSIEHNSDANEAHIGSNSDIAEYEELGTDKIPPRSFLGGAAFEVAPKIIEKLGKYYTAHLAGKGVFNGAMSIDKE